MAEYEKVTLIPERNKVLSNKRLNKRQTTLRAFTFTRDWVSPIPIIPALNQVNVSSQNTSNSHEDVAIETASLTIQQASSDYDEISSEPTSVHQRTPQTKTSQARLHGNSVLESTRLSDMATEEEVRANSNITIDENKGMGETNEVSQPPETDKTLKNPNRSTRRSSRLKASRRHNATEIEHRDDSHVHNQSRLIGHSLSTLKNVDNTDVPDRNSQSRNASRVTDNSSPEDVGSEPFEQDMPDSILTDTNLTHKVSSKNDELSSTPKRPKITSNKKKTTPLSSSMAILASPKSGPAFRHRGELNRKSPPQRKQEPLPKGKVCLWTASERNRSVNDVNELDVVLSNIENECLNFREELSEKPHRKAVSRFFVNTKKDFTSMIALRQEQKFLQSAVRKTKIDVNKKRKLLLALKKQDSRLTLDIDHLKKKQSGKHNTLKTITEFLDGLKEFQMKVDKIQEDSDDATIHKNNIPALLIESAQLSKVNISL
ncbi:uncharacterized protein [Antedon mediterranea]|uniref:uncharacterized protein n=1 Tax=Antedon mediterranea TaxID=105859 RepID=UPI003AF4C6A4